MAVMLRKSLVLEIKQTQTNKTFLKYNFNAHVCVFWSNFMKIVFFFQFFKFHQTKGMVWNVLFEIKHTEFFHSCIFPLLYIVISECGIYQLFYNRSSSYKIHALPISISLAYRYRFQANVDYFENHIQPNFNSFPRAGVIFTSIRLRDGW